MNYGDEPHPPARTFPAQQKAETTCRARQRLRSATGGSHDRMVAILFAAASLLSSLGAALAQEGDSVDANPFHDRWLRSLVLPGVDEIPRFDGRVAEAVRTVETDGAVTEQRVWRFDERGWPTSTELTIKANNQEFNYRTVWHYGADGLPMTIDIEGSVTDSMFLIWSFDTVETESARESSRHSYDSERDVITVEQSAPNEIRREFDFREDGSYSFRFQGRDEDGRWQETLVGEADASNLKTLIQTPVISTELEVVERDARGNPVEAVRTRTGNVSGASTLRWDVVYY